MNPKASSASRVVPGIFAIMIAIASLALLVHHGVYPLSQPNEWVAWVAVVVVAGMYSWLVQKSSDMLAARVGPVPATWLSIALAVTFAYAARVILDAIGFGINSWIIQGDRARGAVIALGVLASSSLVVGGLLLLAGMTIKRHGWSSLSAVTVVLVTIVVGVVLQPRML